MASKPDVTETATSENDASKPTNTEQPTAKEQGTDGQGVAGQAASTASAVKENVFSMFGGGPKKEKKEEKDEGEDEPSGSSKKKAADDDVSRAHNGRSGSLENCGMEHYSEHSQEQQTDKN